MVRHAPPRYRCPFCAIAAGDACDGVYTAVDDVVCRDGPVMAFIASHWWERNPGHVIVVPVEHYENLYELPDEVGGAVFKLSRRIAIALKRSYGCDGMSVRQHNEPAGQQDVWHYHLHVFPRYHDDRLYRADGPKRLASPAERRPFAARLRSALAVADRA
jgi:histidine triad (HIT) family protein